MHRLYHCIVMVCPLFPLVCNAFVNMTTKFTFSPLYFNISNISFHLCYLFSTPPRVYRQVASLVGLQLVTSFISVAKTLGTQRETTQRQLNAEKKKRNDGPRVESLNKRLSAAHDNINVMEEMMRKIFTG